jgi:hypothetical protein
MDLRERILYHQVHPLKLATDWLTAAAAAALLWRHRLAWALAVGFAPAILASAVLIRSADLTACKQSRLGCYVGRFMTRKVELCRFAGLAIFWTGAWRHHVPLLTLGVVAILACWASGLVTARRSAGRW